MAESRNRPGHQYQKPADIPAKQRAKGRAVWAILFAVFGAVIAFFAGGNYIAMSVGAIIAGIAGYFIGIKMEKEAKGK